MRMTSDISRQIEMKLLFYMYMSVLNYWSVKTKKENVNCLCLYVWILSINQVVPFLKHKKTIFHFRDLRIQPKKYPYLHTEDV